MTILKVILPQQNMKFPFISISLFMEWKNVILGDENKKQAIKVFKKYARKIF